MHSLIDNFEGYFPRQQATYLQLEAMDFEYFRRTAFTGACGHKSKKLPKPSIFY